MSAFAVVFIFLPATFDLHGINYRFDFTTILVGNSVLLAVLWSAYVLSALNKSQQRVRATVIQTNSTINAYEINAKFAISAFLSLTSLFLFYAISGVAMLNAGAEFERVALKAGNGEYLILGTAFAYVTIGYVEESYTIIKKAVSLTLLTLLAFSGFKTPFLIGLIILFAPREMRNIFAWRYLFLTSGIFVLVAFYDSWRLDSTTLNLIDTWMWKLAIPLYNSSYVLEFVAAYQSGIGSLIARDVSAFVGDGPFSGAWIHSQMPGLGAVESISVPIAAEGFANFRAPGFIIYPICLIIVAAALSYLPEITKVDGRAWAFLVSFILAKCTISGFFLSMIFTLGPVVLALLIVNATWTLFSRSKFLHRGHR
ncbi:hypothetical protein [uncultured Altererythrobacter sp.]|uniref:hypothetical protein n=1 Tax=uncultured Altererythrobacter sp. TaxID=500840 RepID=UPI0025F3B552|nr:hypothetical protein [uncultured Altererythrobacter sp.]